MPTAEEAFWESYSLDDGSWKKSKQTWLVLKESIEAGTHIRDKQDSHLNTPEGEWVIDASANHRAFAAPPGGRVFSTVVADRGKISQTRQLSVTPRPNRPEGRLVCKGPTDYVIRNARTGRKRGQLISASHDVRHAEVWFDVNGGHVLPGEEKTLLIYSTRQVLEPRMVSLAWVPIVHLLLLIAYMIWVWIV